MINTNITIKALTFGAIAISSLYTSCSATPLKVTITGPSETRQNCSNLYTGSATGGTGNYKNWKWQVGSGVVHNKTSLVAHVQPDSLGPKTISLELTCSSKCWAKTVKTVIVHKDPGQLVSQKWSAAHKGPYTQCSDSVTATSVAITPTWTTSRVITYTGGVNASIAFKTVIEGEVGGSFSVSKATGTQLGLSFEVPVGKTGFIMERSSKTTGSGIWQEWSCSGVRTDVPWTATKYLVDYTAKLIPAT
jgi:hypothetical protein